MSTKNFEITIGYKSVINVSIKAENEEEAKEKAIRLFEKQRNKMFSKKEISLQYDAYDTYGVLNMDETWKMFG